jgi:hypothetical protein
MGIDRTYPVNEVKEAIYALVHSLYRISHETQDLTEVTTFNVSVHMYVRIHTRGINSNIKS